MTGVFNATNEGTPWGELLAGADVTWVTDEFLIEHEVGEWMELPLWIADPAFGRDAPDRRRPRDREWPALPAAGGDDRGRRAAPAVEGVGLTPEREAELLGAWRER